MERILIVEDDPSINALIKNIFESIYDVTTCFRISEAINLLKQHEFDLLILDLTLPNGDGLRLCSRLKQEAQYEDMWIILLTAKTDVEDKIMGFAIGADDYMTKPFEPAELKARVKTALKRLNAKKGNEDKNIMSKGKLKINKAFHTAYLLSDVGEQTINLTPLEYRLLLHLFTHENQVLSRDELISKVWSKDVNVVDRTVDTKVSFLRKKLAESSFTIESVYGEGYRFVHV